MTTELVDWRLPANRREAFQRFYSFHLKYKSHPGLVYMFLPAIAEAYQMDLEQKAWLAWLNGNTQNPVTTMLLLEKAPRPEFWKRAVEFWNENFKMLEWDTDRRHQKSKFGIATELWAEGYGSSPFLGWFEAGEGGWKDTWEFAKGQPYMGRLSAWSMTEYARILLGNDIVPDADNWLLDDVSGSRSHRNGIALVGGYDSVHWEAEVPKVLGIVKELEWLADDLLREAEERNCDPEDVWKVHPDVGRLTMESAFCTYKSWHKPNRRYPNVYSDMAYNRIKKGEARFGNRFDILWDARRKTLPEYLRLEDQPYDPGTVAIKQNHYLETGEVIMMDQDYPDMKNSFSTHVADQSFGIRKDPKW